MVEKFISLFGGIYKDKNCFITGHTGFKGSWLAYWLTKMGAKVIGYSLNPPTIPNHFELLKDEYISIIGDIRDKESIRDAILKHKSDIVFHLAAQAIVRLSYKNPVETFETNLLGTLNILEACRKASSVKAIINITSDKCYENKEWIWGYRENDPMGGHDPYSASKGCSEILTSSYRNSFFNVEDYGKKHNILLASARAGNVIGGGDWAEDRLIPDIIRAASTGEKVEIRNPKATRPWQHVLEPLSGYLTLGWKLLQGEKKFASGWNFGPEIENNVPVSEIVTLSKTYWSDIDFTESENKDAVHEANLLMLDCSQAKKVLKWKPVWNFPKTLKKTIEWYKAFYQTKTINTEKDLFSYIKGAQAKGIEWSR
jgi:CDP-glucose 4,6-dehydratase